MSDRSPLEEQLFSFRLGGDIAEQIQSVTKVRGSFVIVTDFNVYVAEDGRDGHFQIQRIGFIP